MTRDEIMKLTPDELRAEIAKRRGYELKHGFLDEVCINPKDYWVTPAGRLTSVLPDWTTDIAAAWELVEEMITPKDESLAAILASHRPYIIWNGEDWIYLVSGDESDEQVARGTTLPLAISRAWLIWKTEAK